MRAWLNIFLAYNYLKNVLSHWEYSENSALLVKFMDDRIVWLWKSTLYIWWKAETQIHYTKSMHIKQLLLCLMHIHFSLCNICTYDHLFSWCIICIDVVNVILTLMLYMNYQDCHWKEWCKWTIFRFACHAMMYLYQILVCLPAFLAKQCIIWPPFYIIIN